MNKRYEAIYGAAVVAIAKEWFARSGDANHSIIRAAELTRRYRAAFEASGFDWPEQWTKRCQDVPLQQLRAWAEFAEWRAERKQARAAHAISRQLGTKNGQA